MVLPPDIWGVLLPTITLPSLSNLSIIWCRIGSSVLSAFLVRHASITTLNLHSLLNHEPNLSPPKSILPNLETLNADAEIVTLLRRAKLPNLKWITAPIKLTYPDLQSELSELDGVFAGLTRKSEIGVRLEVAMEFNPGEWVPSEGPVNKEDKNEEWRHLVKIVGFNTSICDDNLEGMNKREFLPKWLSERFWALERVYVGSDCGCLVCEYHQVSRRKTLEESIREICPSVKDVIINGI